MAIIVYFKRMIFHFFVNVIASSFFIIPKLRYYLMVLFGMDLGTKWIRSKCFFSTSNISIGNGTFINSHCKFYSSEYEGGKITIGEKCYIGMNTIIGTATHEIGDSAHRAGKNKYMPAVVGDGTWIGTNVTILPGVTIGKGCIIAAGAVVNKDCAPNGMYAGVPAKRIKDLD